jgi:hypothetical protein
MENVSKGAPSVKMVNVKKQQSKLVPQDLQTSLRIQLKVMILPAWETCIIQWAIGVPGNVLHPVQMENALKSVLFVKMEIVKQQKIKQGQKFRLGLQINLVLLTTKLQMEEKCKIIQEKENLHSAQHLVPMGNVLKNVQCVKMEIAKTQRKMFHLLKTQICQFSQDLQIIMKIIPVLGECNILLIVARHQDVLHPAQMASV